MFRAQNLSQFLSQLVVVLPPSPLPTPPASPLDDSDTDIFYDFSAGHSNKNFLGDAFSRASPTATTMPIPSAAAPRSPGSSSSSSVRARTTVASGSIESPVSDVHAPVGTIAYSDRVADLNDSSFDMDPQHMEGTIRPSRRVSSGYGHGHGYGYPVDEMDMDFGNAAAASQGSGRTRPRRAPQYEQSTIRGGSGISRAMAQPESGRQPQSQQRIPQYERTGAPRPAIPVSINGAPDEGDPILSARWDYGLNGRFVFPVPSSAAQLTWPSGDCYSCLIILQECRFGIVRTLVR